jgi:hypothetical protein
MYHPKKLGSSIGTTLLLILACLLGSAQKGLGQATLPLKPNQLVITCFSGTSNNAVIPDPDNYVIGFMDTRDPLGDGATLGSNWAPPPGWAFHNETSADEWTAGNLGEVFGVTLDDAPAPNIYTSASTVYGDFPPGPGGHGAVYRLDGNTGAISYLTLPGIGKASLGNLCHWESGNGTSWLYVTSFEDGLVYRINVDSWSIEAVSYDHGVDGRTGASMTPIPDAGTPDTMTALGRRVWGVKAFQDRLYYGVWWEDKVNPSAALANEIWSVALDASTGQFLPNTAILEATLPPRNVFSNYSLPVASIDFSPAGMMLLAERYYRWDGVHQARVLSYVGTSGSWTPNPTDQYRVGDSAILSAGGVVADCEENVWATGDILHGNIYGVQRIPAGGNASDSPATANSVLIDIDGDIVNQDKTMIGALAIWNDCDCMLVENVEIDCPTEEGGPYSVGFDITNQSGQTAQWVLLTPETGVTGILPNNIPLSPALAHGDTMSLTDIELLGVVPGTDICFNVTLLSLKQGQLEECCTKKIRLRVPECGCVEMEVTSVDCQELQADGTTIAKVCFEVTNQGTDDLYYIYPLPDPSMGWTVTPSYIALTPPLAPGETREICFEINGVHPGQTAKLPLTFHNESMQTCCLRTLCFDVPQKDDPHQEGICCWLPEVVFCCPNIPNAKTVLVICNKSNQDREISWAIQIPPATPDCPVVLDPSVDFTPNSGTVAVPAGECIEVPLELSCLKLMQGQLPCAWWGVSLTDTETGEKSFCRSQLKFSDDPTVKHVGNGNPENISPGLVTIPVGSTADVAFVAENPADHPVSLQLVATETSRLLGFKQGNLLEQTWTDQIEIAAGEKKIIRMRLEWKSDKVDLSNIHGLASLNLFWRKNGSPTQTATMVPLQLVGRQTGNGSPNLRSVTLESPENSDPCIKLECASPFQTSMIVEASQGLNGDWEQIPFSTAIGSPMNQWTVNSESVETTSVYVALDGDCCFYRVRNVTED